MGRTMIDNQQQDAVNTQKNGFSLLSFCNRRPEDQQGGKQRALERQLAIETFPDKPPFLHDMETVENTSHWRLLQGEYQFDVGLGYDYQSRITHTNDVKNVGARLGRELHMDEDSIDLIRAICAMHDLGHMPFSHWGERAAIAKLKPYGKLWNHDAAGLRVVTEWANGGLSHAGLNLTRDTLEGLTKRYWHYRDDEEISKFNHDIAELPSTIRKIDEILDLSLDKHCHAEGQIASIADWISITVTDIEDGLRLGRMTIKEVCEHFPAAKELYERNLAEINMYEEENGEGLLKTDPEGVKDGRYASLARLFAEHIKEMLIKDVVRHTNKNLNLDVQNGMEYADDVRSRNELIVGFSPEMQQDVNRFSAYCLKDVFPRIIHRHGPLQEMVERTLDDIVNGTLELPQSWRQQMDTIRNNTALTPRQQKGALIEAACAYMVCVMDDNAVCQNIRMNHPEFWEAELADRQVDSRLSTVGTQVPLAQRYVSGRTGASAAR